MKLSFLLLIHLSLQLHIQCNNIKSTNKNKKTIPRKHITYFRKATTFNLIPDKIISTSTTGLASQYNKKIYEHKEVEPITMSDLIHKELLHCIISSTVKSSLKNGHLIHKGKYKSFINKVLLDNMYGVLVKVIFYLIHCKYVIGVRVMLFTIANIICCFGKTTVYAFIHLLKQLIKFYGYAKINYYINKHINAKNVVLKAVNYAIVSLMMDYVVDTFVSDAMKEFFGRI